MKKWILLFLSTVSLLFAQSQSEPQVTAIDGYAARVNSRVITYGDIRAQIASAVEQLTRQVQGAELVRQLKQLHIEGREALIEEALILEEAKRKKLQLPDFVIDEEVNSILQDRFKGQRVELMKHLRQRHLSFEAWRETLRDTLVMRVYYNQEVLRHVHVSAEAVRAEYERLKQQFLVPFRVKYRSILINKGVTAEEQAVKRKQAEATWTKLQQGADFAAVAREVSEGDPDLSPWRDPADLKPEIRPALRRVPAGQISELIEGETVFYIIQVESRQEQGYVPFDDVRETIRRGLFAKERRRLHDRLVERLSSHHYIERY